MCIVDLCDSFQITTQIMNYAVSECWNTDRKNVSVSLHTLRSLCICCQWYVSGGYKQTVGSLIVSVLILLYSRSLILLEYADPYSLEAMH